MIDPGTHALPDGIVTPEGVVLSFVEAGLGSRSLAFLLDLIIRVVLLLGVTFAMAFAGTTSELVIVVVYTVVIFSVLLVYPVAFEMALNGRTPGKMALGLRVVTVEGGPVRFRHAAVRSGIGLVDFMMSAGVVAVVVSLLNRRSQRLGDVVAGTMVVRERSAVKHADAVAFAPPYGWEAFSASLDVSRLNGDVAVLIRGFLLRANSLGPAARWRLGRQLASEVSSRIGVPLPPQAHPEAFLVAVVAAHQRARTPKAPSTAPSWSPTSNGHVPVLAADDLSPTWGT